MDDPHLGHLPGSPGPIRRDGEVRPGTPEVHQLAQRRRPAPGRRPADGAEPEPGHDALDQFPIPMSADEDVDLRAPIRQRHHELAAVPEGKNAVPPLRIERQHGLGPLGSDPQRSAQQPDERSPDGREQV